MGWFKKHIVIMYEILKKNQTKQNQTTTNKNQGLASQPVVARKKKSTQLFTVATSPWPLWQLSWK